MLNIIKARLLKSVVTERIHCVDRSVSPYEAQGEKLRAVIIRKFGRSLHVREVDTGSCGACESEIIACNNPVYDLQRFGVNFVASPRHADCLLVTGPLSKNMVLALKRTWEAMPEPRFCVTCGDCAMGGGPFRDAYYVENGVSSVIPVALHIPGCPPAPQAIIFALTGFLAA